MNVNLSQDQQSELHDLVESGRFASTDEAISESVRLLLLREKIQVGIDEADHGELIDHDTVFAELRAKAAQLQRDNGRE